MLDLENSTEEYKCYTNKSKDGRLRCVLVYKNGFKRNISYPKLIMEKHLGRKLFDDEQVHHIDENPLNNDISNLQILKLGEHQKFHQSYRKHVDRMGVCYWCKKEFVISANHIRNHKKFAIGYFCSRKCSGEYGAFIQNKHKYL